MNYISKAGIQLSSSDNVFRNIFKVGDVEKLRETKLSYTRAREIIRETLREIGLNPNNFGTHSLRAGGATTASVNNVSAQKIKLHGRWKTDTAKDRYIKPNLDAQLEVSKSLNL